MITYCRKRARASEPEDEIPSYQPITKPTEITAKNQRNGENKKRKGELKFQILRLHFWIQLYTKANVSILDITTHFKPTETFQYTHFSSSHPSGVKKGFVKGESLRLLRTNSSRTTFEENIYKFKSRLLARGYPKSLIETLLSDVKFTERESALPKKNEN